MPKSAAKKKKSDEPNFEKDLEQLEEIVSALEEGGLPLDESLQKFEEGIQLAKRCEKTLSAAEKKIEVLTRNAEGELETENFEGDPGETGAAAAPEKKTGGELLF